MRFALRDLLWLTVVVGLSLGWYLHYQRLTRPPKLYRDEEIVHLMRYNSHYIVDTSVNPPRLLVVPEGKSMPLSQVFKTLRIDPSRLTDFQHRQYNRSITLSWQLSPSYDLSCITTDDDDDALAFDDPKRNIYNVIIHERDNR
jgi:hypothetical protein